jgi:hypothetical protein
MVLSPQPVGSDPVPIRHPYMTSSYYLMATWDKIPTHILVSRGEVFHVVLTVYKKEKVLISHKRAKLGSTLTLWLSPKV